MREPLHQGHMQGLQLNDIVTFELGLYVREARGKRMDAEGRMAAEMKRRRELFDIQKAIAATGYLVEHTGESMYSLMKMMYLADKVHLERYGRFIAGDTHCALKQGPVPSNTYDLMKHVRGEPQDELPGADLAKEYFSYGPDHQVSLLKQPDYGELSESDIECLAIIVDTYKKVGKWSVRDLAHDDAWKATWRGRSRPISTELIARAIGDVQLMEHLRDPEPGAAA